MTTKALTKPIMTPGIFDDFFKPWNEWFDDDRFVRKMMTMPLVNITEDGNYYIVSLAAPGLKKEDFKIKVEGDMLTISSEKEETSKVEDEKYNRKEYNFSSFSRSFTLPDNVKIENIEARYEDGVLKINLPVKEEVKKVPTQKIEVK